MSSRIPMWRLPVGALLVVAACGVLPASAWSAPTLSVTPSTFAAGGAPNLTTTITFNANSGESAKDVTLQLAPGVLANAAANPTCLTTRNVTVGGPCQIGTDELDASSYPEDHVFLVPPPSGVPSAVAGLTTTYFSTLGITGAVVLRDSPGDWPGTSEPNVGLDVQFSELPYTGILLQSLTLSLDSTLNGAQFTHAPTYCGSFTPALLSVDYENSGGTTGTTPAASNVAAPNVTVAGCPLAFTPALSATSQATAVKGTDAVSVTGTVSFASPLTDATIRSAALALPSIISPNLALIGNECKATDVATCPTADPSSIVGTARSAVAVLPASDGLTGDVVILPPTGGVYPKLAIVINKVGATTLTSPIVLGGTTNDATGNFTTTISGLPDIPLSSLTLSLRNTALTTTCSTRSGPFDGVFTDQNGDPAVTVHSTLTISPCPMAAVTPPSTGTGKRSGTSAAKLISFTVTLPVGLSFNPKTVRKGVSVAGGRIKRITLRHGKLAITLRSGVAKLKVSLSAAALRVSASLKRRITHEHLRFVTASIVAKNSRGKTTHLTLKLTHLLSPR